MHLSSAPPTVSSFVVAVLSAVAFVAVATMAPAPAEAGRRIDAAKKAEALLGKIATAKGDHADRLEQEIAALATDLMYMDDVEPVLIKGLTSRNQAQRKAAARLLRYTVSGAAVPALGASVAKDRSEDVRLEAATSLCLLKGGPAAGHLRTAKTGDKSARVRAAAAAALEVIEDPSGKGSRGCRVSLQRHMAALL